MLTDAVIADHTLALYSYADGPKVDWEYVQEQLNDVDGHIRWGLARLDGFDLIVLRGTASIRDVIRDFFAIPAPFYHPQLGFLHSGFFNGMNKAWAAIRPRLKQPTIVAGHSLGGARAAILTGLMVIDKQPPVRRVTFGEPRAGFARLREVISQVPATFYVNDGGGFLADPIPDVPIAVGSLVFVDSYRRTKISVKPSGRQFLWGPVASHHMELYRKALQ